MTLPSLLLMGTFRLFRTLFSKTDTNVECSHSLSSTTFLPRILMDKKVDSPKKGDYVLATKWSDGDPHDQWAVGFLSEKLDNERFLVVDKEGRSFRHNGFRRIKKITKDQGNDIISHTSLIEESSKSLWDWLEMEHEN